MDPAIRTHDNWPVRFRNVLGVGFGSGMLGAHQARLPEMCGLLIMHPKAVIAACRREGGEAYLTDISDAEMHRFQSGHFAMEDYLPFNAEKTIEFYDRLK